jgi:hypothetical protein
MNWELGEDQNYQVLVDYEAELDEFIARRPIVGLCQYQRMTLPGLAIRNALETHEHVIMGNQLCTNNLFYEPPAIRLETDERRKQEKRVEWMCQRLAQAMKAEKQRDSALRTLLEKQAREPAAAA